MKRAKRILAFVLLLALLMPGCGGPSAPAPAASAAPTSAPTPTPAPTPEATQDPLKAQVAALTVEQLVGQLLVAGIEGTVPGEDARQAVSDYQVGGVILFRRNVSDVAQLAALSRGLRALETGDIPLLLAVDEEGGLVSRMPEALVDLPDMYTYGQTGDTDLARRVGQALGAACAAFGIGLDFAPVLDVWSNPDNTVIGTRSFGSDAQTVSAMGTAVMSGLLEAGVLPVVKHFPGHGDTAVDSHYGLPVVDKSREDLEQLELVPFRAAIAQGAPAIMVAHILLTGLDETYPASLSPAVVTGLLRQELGFDGVVCTDDLTMAAVADSWGMGEAAVLAVEAGCDLLLVCHGADNLAAARQALLSAVEEGRISRQRLEESVCRLLALRALVAGEDWSGQDPDVAALNRQLTAALPS